MAKLQNLKSRSENLKNTSQILLSMKSLARSNFIKARKLHTKSRAYVQDNSVISCYALYALYKQVPLEISPLIYNMFKNRPKVKRLIIVMGADRSLCASYNSTVFNKTVEQVEQACEKGEDFRLLVVGSRTFDQVRARWGEGKVLPIHTNLHIRELSGAFLNRIVEPIAKGFSEQEFSAVSLVYMSLTEGLKQEACVAPLFPVDFTYLGKLINRTPLFLDKVNLVTDAEILSVVPQLVEQYLFIWVYRSLVDSILSFYSAKMALADGAWYRAEAQVQKSELDYKRERQAKITNELLELIAPTL